MHQLNWIKCDGNAWCTLLNLNLTHPHFEGLEGVYIIWHGGPTPRTVYVGQGIIRERLGAHRNDADILQYSKYGLFTTWAAVDVQQRDGVERYLADSLNPLVGTAYPAVVAVHVPIPANFPW